MKFFLKKIHCGVNYFPYICSVSTEGRQGNVTLKKLL